MLYSISDKLFSVDLSTRSFSISVDFISSPSRNCNTSNLGIYFLILYTWMCCFYVQKKIFFVKRLNELSRNCCY